MKKYLLSLSTAIALVSVAPAIASNPNGDDPKPANFFKGYALKQDEADVKITNYSGDGDAYIIATVQAFGQCSKPGVYNGLQVAIHPDKWRQLWAPNKDQPRPPVGTNSLYRVLLKYKQLEQGMMAFPVELKVGVDRKKDDSNKAEKDAADKAAKEAADKAAKEKAEKDYWDKYWADQKAAKDAADKAAKEKAAKEKAEKDYWDNYYKQQAKEAADRAAKEKAAKDAADKAAREKAAKEKANKDYWDNYHKQQAKEAEEMRAKAEAAADAAYAAFKAAQGADFNAYKAAKEKAAKDAADRAAKEKAGNNWWDNNNNNYGGNNNNNYYYGGYSQPKQPEQPKYEYKPEPWFEAAYRSTEPAYSLENALANLKPHLTAAEIKAIPAGTNPAVLADLYYTWLYKMDNGWEYNYNAFKMDRPTAATFYYAKFVLKNPKANRVAFQISPNLVGSRFDAEQYLLNYPHVREEAVNSLADPHLYAAAHYQHYRQFPQFAHLTDKKRN